MQIKQVNGRIQSVKGDVVIQSNCYEAALSVTSQFSNYGFVSFH
jgi:hypothetical protein